MVLFLDSLRRQTGRKNIVFAEGSSLFCAALPQAV